jgi:hypothetical protein
MLARIGEPVELARSILLIAIRVDYSSRTEWMNGNVVLFYRDHIDHLVYKTLYSMYHS